MATGKGINTELVPAAQDAISTYKSNMANRLNEFKTEIDFSTAFIGEQQSLALSSYYGTLMDRVNETFAYLDSFSTAINDAKEQYRQEELRIVDSLNNSGSTNNNVSNEGPKPTALD